MSLADPVLWNSRPVVAGAIQSRSASHCWAKSRPATQLSRMRMQRRYSICQYIFFVEASFSLYVCKGPA